jgi:hypothetical protein
LDYMMMYVIEPSYVMRCFTYDHIWFLHFIDGFFFPLYVLCVGMPKIMKKKGFNMEDMPCKQKM